MPAPEADMEGPGFRRTITARWVIQADLVLESAALLAGESEGTADLTVLRDRSTGRPLLTGASLAGALRSHLADRLGDYRKPEPAEVAALFGAQRGDDEGAQSPVIVYDALASSVQSELRDGVAIDSSTGTAADHAKFDLELLPKGTTFPIRVDLLVADPAAEENLLSLLTTALGGLSRGEIALGVRRSRGLGSLGTREWRAERFDVTSGDGWVRWCLSDYDDRSGQEKLRFPDSATACRAAWPRSRISDMMDMRTRTEVTADLRFVGGLLIRAAPDQAAAPDAVQVKSGGDPVLVGSSLAGVLRARARRILRLVCASRDDADRRLEELFGPDRPAQRQPAHNLWASRLRVSETAVHAKPQRVTRVQIDRFTQGTVAGALFDEEPVYEGSVEVRIELRDPQKGENGLLLLLLKDLLSGDLPVGGTGSVGRGVATGTAIWRTLNGREVRLNPSITPKPADAALLQSWIDELYEAPASPDRHVLQ